MDIVKVGSDGVNVVKMFLKITTKRAINFAGSFYVIIE